MIGNPVAWAVVAALVPFYLYFIFLGIGYGLTMGRLTAFARVAKQEKEVSNG
jgi:uncharacterized RDD family membrane protein YckC